MFIMSKKNGIDAFSCTSVVSISSSHLPSTTTLNLLCTVYMVFWFLLTERSRISGGFNWPTAHHSQSSASILPQPLNPLSSHQLTSRPLSPHPRIAFLLPFSASVSFYPDIDCLLLCKCPKNVCPLCEKKWNSAIVWPLHSIVVRYFLFHKELNDHARP